MEITYYLDPFDFIDVSPLIESWELMRQYERAKLERFEREYQQDFANGRGIFAAPLDIPARLEQSKRLVRSSEAGKMKAMRMQEYRRQQYRSVDYATTAQTKMFKAKCN